MAIANCIATLWCEGYEKKKVLTIAVRHTLFGDPMGSHGIPASVLVIECGQLRRKENTRTSVIYTIIYCGVHERLHAPSSDYNPGIPRGSHMWDRSNIFQQQVSIGHDGS